MAPNPRFSKAFYAMKVFGISEDIVKPVLKRLLKLYDKNWEPIEEENYRVLLDAIFEQDEDDTNVHTKRRNRLHQEKMKDLVFVMHNLKLERKIRNISTCEVNDDDDDDDDLDVSSDDEWIVEEDVDSSK